MKKNTLTLCCFLLGLSLLNGCNTENSQQEQESQASSSDVVLTTEKPVSESTSTVATASPTVAPTATPTTAPSATPVPTENVVLETKTLKISFINLSNINIGMLSVIDPVTGTQMNVDSLASGESLSLDSNWPSDTFSFQWALYNEAGVLCMDATTDITGVEKALALVLTGDGTIENIEVISE